MVLKVTMKSLALLQFIVRFLLFFNIVREPYALLGLEILRVLCKPRLFFQLKRFGDSTECFHLMEVELFGGHRAGRKQPST